MNLTHDIIYVGVNDKHVDLFEGQYRVPNGMAYNSYVILDEKIAVMDTVDIHFTHEWLDNLSSALGDRKPDYLIVQHMEPDHSANIAAFLQTYPNAKVVANTKTITMIGQFFESLSLEGRTVLIENGGTLSLGKHTLTFVFAPMVHWPEVMDPNALGIDGPVISASRIAVEKPRLFIETAKSDVISDLPTPPLPLTTPITFLIFESSCGFSKRLFGSREEQF